jgi:hypothetical protein
VVHLKGSHLLEVVVMWLLVEVVAMIHLKELDVLMTVKRNTQFCKSALRKFLNDSLARA